MTPDAATRARAMHEAWCAELVPMQYELWQLRWERVASFGFDADDVRLIIRWMRIKNAAFGKGAGYSWNLRRLIDDPSDFEARLVEAKADMRNRKAPMTNKERVLKDANMTPAASVVDAKPVGEIAARLVSPERLAKYLEEMRKAAE